MDDSNETELGRIKKSESTDIVIRKTVYKGESGIDIREYIKSERYTGWSKNGVRILLKDWPDFKKILDSV
jgi:hypothetical protein